MNIVSVFNIFEFVKINSPWPINKEKPIYQSLLQNVKKVSSSSFKVIFLNLKIWCKLLCFVLMKNSQRSLIQLQVGWITVLHCRNVSECWKPSAD